MNFTTFPIYLCGLKRSLASCIANNSFIHMKSWVTFSSKPTYEQQTIC